MLIFTAHGGIMILYLIQCVALIVFGRDLNMKILGRVNVSGGLIKEKAALSRDHFNPEHQVFEFSNGCLYHLKTGI